jgi:hypothetical protein
MLFLETPCERRPAIALPCSFENYLSYSALAGTDDEAVAGGFNDRSRDDMKVIHAENSLDLSEEPSQKPEISAAHPNEARYHFRNELLVWEDNAGRRPSFSSPKSRH